MTSELTIFVVLHINVLGSCLIDRSRRRPAVLFTLAESCVPFPDGTGEVFTVHLSGLSWLTDYSGFNRFVVKHNYNSSSREPGSSLTVEHVACGEYL